MISVTNQSPLFKFFELFPKMISEILSKTHLLGRIRSFIKFLILLEEHKTEIKLANV